MRPDILNPLFAESETLDGVGPKLKKPLDKLGLTRVRAAQWRMWTRRARESKSSSS
jgi:ATP-dependent DNA helicase RecG